MIDFLIKTYQHVSIYQIILEFIAFVFGLFSVYYAKKQNILVYPLGLICTIISVYLLYINKFFGDMTINIYYSFMSIYGWVIWNNKSENNIIKISFTNGNEKIIGLVLFLLTVFFTYFVYLQFGYHLEISNYLDMFTSGIFFTAMWLMAKKKIENWILWIVGDLITVPLYCYRGLGMLSLQYLIFFIIAVFAYYEWNNVLKSQNITIDVQSK
jgi:nicotinamide mononucleotide transporter